MKEKLEDKFAEIRHYGLKNPKSFLRGASLQFLPVLLQLDHEHGVLEGSGLVPSVLESVKTSEDIEAEIVSYFDLLCKHPTYGETVVDTEGALATMTIVSALVETTESSVRTAFESYEHLVSVHNGDVVLKGTDIELASVDLFALKTHPRIYPFLEPHLELAAGDLNFSGYLSKCESRSVIAVLYPNSI